MGPTWGNWLFYLTGGLAFGEVTAFDSLFAVSGSQWRVGWTFGGGVQTGPNNVRVKTHALRKSRHDNEPAPA